MIVAKLLHVIVQPVFVLVDTDTNDVQAAPVVQPVPIPAASLAQVPEMIEQARQQLAEQIQQPPSEG